MKVQKKYVTRRKKLTKSLEIMTKLPSNVLIKVGLHSPPQSPAKHTIFYITSHATYTILPISLHVAYAAKESRNNTIDSTQTV